jgi:hypothetical protein
MLLRNVNERLQIISRKDCKNETEYNKKLYNLRQEYMSKYKSVFINTNTINISAFKTDSLEQSQTKSEEI